MKSQVYAEMRSIISPAPFPSSHLPPVIATACPRATAPSLSTFACKNASPGTVYPEGGQPCVALAYKVRDAIRNPPASLGLDAEKTLALRKEVTRLLMMYIGERDDWTVRALYYFGQVLVRTPEFDKKLEGIMANPNHEVAAAAANMRTTGLVAEDTTTLDLGKGWIAAEPASPHRSTGFTIVADNAYMGVPGHYDYVAKLVLDARLPAFNRASLAQTLGFQRAEALPVLQKLTKKLAKASSDDDKKVQEAVAKALEMASAK